jgi:hypothetical protein
MMKRNRYNVEYPAVTTDDVLAHLAKAGKCRAADIGETLWPHLIGRGSANGGPSACQYTASAMLGRMRKKGLVYQDDPAWAITSKGRAAMAEAANGRKAS